MRTGFIKTAIATLALMFSGLVFADPVELLENGGFEDADLFPWVGGGNTLVVVAGLGGEIDPRSGSWMAVLAEGGLFSADLTQTFVPGDLSGFTELVVSFSLNIAGINFSQDEFDRFTVSLGGFTETMDIDLPLEKMFISDWIDISFTISLDDILDGEVLTLQFFLDNCLPGDCDQLVTIFLDDISVLARADVPEPGTLALFGLGLLGLGLRRRARKG